MEHVESYSWFPQQEQGRAPGCRQECSSREGKSQTARLCQENSEALEGSNRTPPYRIHQQDCQLGTVVLPHALVPPSLLEDQDEHDGATTRC